MKTFDLIMGICFGIICVLAIVEAFLQNRIELFAVSFITGVIAEIDIYEYFELKRKGS